MESILAGFEFEGSKRESLSSHHLPSEWLASLNITRRLFAQNFIQVFGGEPMTGADGSKVLGGESLSFLNLFTDKETPLENF